MTTVKGPAIFLAQFMGDSAPFDTLENISKWAADLGFIGVQIPSWDARCIDLEKVAESQTYADEYKGKLNDLGLEVTELSSWASSKNRQSVGRDGFQALRFE